MARKKQSEILKFLTDEDKVEFLEELLDAIKTARREGSLTAVNECIKSWEATAELNSIPGLRERTWQKFNKLKASGLIHG
jgi:hypothetical protein